MISIQQIEQFDLSFMTCEKSRNLLLNCLNALITTQKYVDEQYSKLWAEEEIDPGFFAILNDLNSLNVIEHFRTVAPLETKPCLQMIFCNITGCSTGFTRVWIIRNIQKLLTVGNTKFKEDYEKFYRERNRR